MYSHDIRALIYEQTIRSAVQFTGVGLHSGAQVRMRILPAKAGTGVVFRRSDLDDFEVEATGRNVAKVSYATSLMKKGVLISTTEHLLSSFIGLGVDNAIVELDNLEVPILDGSAKPYIDELLASGLKQQRRPRTYLRIKKPVEVHEGDKFIGVYPAEGYQIEYTINFAHPLIQCQSLQVDLAQGGYQQEIAPARTFGFLHEEKMLKNMGLIRGASEENVIVLTRNAVKNGPLRYENEFIRHKVLDLIGDLSLLGKQIIGKVVADRAGHAMHTALVSRLLRDHSLWEETHLESESRQTASTEASAASTELRA